MQRPHPINCVFCGQPSSQRNERTVWELFRQSALLSLRAVPFRPPIHAKATHGADEAPQSLLLGNFGANLLSEYLAPLSVPDVTPGAILGLQCPVHDFLVVEASNPPAMHHWARDVLGTGSCRSMRFSYLQLLWHLGSVRRNAYSGTFVFHLVRGQLRWTFCGLVRESLCNARSWLPRALLAERTVAN